MKRYKGDGEHSVRELEEMVRVLSERSMVDSKAMSEMQERVRDFERVLEFYARHHHHLNTTSPNFAREALASTPAGSQDAEEFPEKEFKEAAVRLIGKQAEFDCSGDRIEPGDSIGWSYNHQRMKDCRKGARWMFERMRSGR